MSMGTGDFTTHLKSPDLGPPPGGAAPPSGSGYRLAPGTPLGPYTILGPIGVGGMGEVYAAHDPALKRDIAIKILPRDLASDNDRLDRFRREAKVLASLNHPNVAAIYGLYDTGNMLALVMELVTGETVAQRLARGPLPVKESLAVALQIAEALQSAHEQGIVHRDLKPANIKIRPDDEVKVLDFGLAKALDPRTGSVSTDRVDGSDSHDYLTATGVILGTGPYMAPEQIRGRGVDRRADIWAFGVVCWEMLTGRRLFTGETLSDVLASVLHTEPDWSQLPSDTPPIVRRLLRRCLEKNPRLRLDSATAIRLDLQEALDGSDIAEGRRDRRWIPWTIGGASLVALLLVLSNALVGRPPASPAAVVNAELGADISLRQDLGSAIVVSPDGRTLVFASAATTTPSKLYVRRIEELEARALDGTENAISPFFSPDGQWIGFFADEKLKRISVAGGTAFDICAAPEGRGGSWSDDGKWIVFSPDNSAKTVLMRVAVAGGAPEAVTSLLPEDIEHRWPQVLPGGRHVLYTSSTSADWNEARLIVQPLSGGAPKVVQPGFYGRYVATTGHLLYVQRGTLYAAPFDAQRLEVTGPPAAVLENIVADPTTGGAQYALSDTGTLVFLQGREFTRAVPVASMARGGHLTTLVETRQNWANPQVSPSGSHLALDVHDGRNRDIYILDLTTMQMSRLTFDAAEDYKPVWTPDGERLVFTSTRNGSANLYWQRADGAGPVERLTNSPNPQTAGSWNRTGGLLAYEETRPGTGKDILILPFDVKTGRPGTPRVFAGGPFNEAEPVFSPDGRWLAFHSNATGGAEVFVRRFDGDEGHWQVSAGGGRDAVWSTTRPELLYFSTTERRIISVRFRTSETSFRVDPPRPWSVIAMGRPPREGRTFHLHPDGEHVIGVPPERQSPLHMTLIFDFFSRLRRTAQGAD